MGIEEEFAILDPETLELQHRFEELRDAAQADDELAASVRGELIDTEIEIRSGRGETFAEAAERQRERRRRLFALAAEHDAALASAGTHPWANYLDQRIIDTEHYNRLRDELRWVVQRNNTWSLHVHVGVRGADRAVTVTDRLREVLPDPAGRVGELAVPRRPRHRASTRSGPRSSPAPSRAAGSTSRSGAGPSTRTSSRSSPRPTRSSRRPSSGGACGPTTRSAPSRSASATPRPAATSRSSSPALIASCVGQAAIDVDEGRDDPLLGQKQIEENLWRAIRYGMGGEMLDFSKRETVPTRKVLDDLIEWTAPARAAMGLDDPSLPEENGAQRSLRELAGGASIPEIYRDAVERTRATFAPVSVERSGTRTQ